jgi:ribose 5-phosphate isomerase RpiB
MSILPTGGSLCVSTLGATSGTQPDDYPDFAEAVGMAVRNNRVDRGVLALTTFCSPLWDPARL